MLRSRNAGDARGVTRACCALADDSAAR